VLKISSRIMTFSEECFPHPAVERDERDKNVFPLPLWERPNGDMNVSPHPAVGRDEGDKDVFPLPWWEGMKGRGESTVGVKGLTGVARRLRRTSTDTERQLWRHIRDRQLEGFKFRRQQPVGRYVVDFVNLEERVIIEVDGGQHALGPGDKIRDEWLRSEGYKVLRFWNNQVLNNMEGVLETIRNALLTPHPDPLPQGERGRRG
jgi:very-short-patch-repair endonuclease